MRPPRTTSTTRRDENRPRPDPPGSPWVRAREAAGELGAFAVDSVQGLGEIVAFQQESSRGDKLDRLSQRHISLRLPFFSELTKQHAVLEILTGLGGLAVVATGDYQWMWWADAALALAAAFVCLPIREDRPATA